MSENDKVRKAGAGAQGHVLDYVALEAACRAWWAYDAPAPEVVSWDTLSERGDHRIEGWRGALEVAILAYFEAEESGSLERSRRLSAAIEAMFAEQFGRLEDLTEQTAEFAARLETDLGPAPRCPCRVEPAPEVSGADEDRAGLMRSWDIPRIAGSDKGELSDITAPSLF